MPPTSHHLQGIDGGRTGAQAIDHLGPPRHPHRVTIMRLARAKETYELRWRENVRAEDGAVTRVRRTAPGGHSKAAAYARAENVWRNLDRSARCRTGGHASWPADLPPASTASLQSSDNGRVRMDRARTD